MISALSLFPIWAFAGFIAAWLWPEAFVAYKTWVVPLLGVVMLGMGLTLTPSDFVCLAKRPWIVAYGALLQYTLMPLWAWLVSKGLGLDGMLLAGMVLVGTAPGGTASNVICYLAGADVALSIALTLTSTMMSVLMTPLLTACLIGHRVEVPVLGMMASIVKIVVIPVAVGMAVNHFAHAKIERWQRLFPVISMAAIVFIIAVITALNHDNLHHTSLLVAVAVMLHNGFGLASGYLLGKTVLKNERLARTLAIEVGMQNSGLAVALALKHFSALAALPGVLFSIWHNITGSILAGIWAARKTRS